MEFPTGGISYPRGSRTPAPHRQQGTCQGLQLKLSSYLKVCISQSVFPTGKQLKSQLYAIAVCEIQTACMGSKEKLWKTATALAGAFLEGRAVPVPTAQPKIHWKMLYRYCQCTLSKKAASGKFQVADYFINHKPFFLNLANFNEEKR